MAKPRVMKMLIEGEETKVTIDALIELTSIRSEAVIKALHDMYVDGLSESRAAALNMLDASNLNRSIKKVNAAMVIVERIKEDHWGRFKKQNGVK